MILDSGLLMVLRVLPFSKIPPLLCSPYAPNKKGSYLQSTDNSLNFLELAMGFEPATC
jgi:hypothetical protein